MANTILYGFHDIADRFETPVVELVPEVEAAIQATIDEHNRQTAAMLDLFTERTTEAAMRFRTRVFPRLQSTDSLARAIPQRTQYSVYDTGFPIFKAGTAWGVTREKRLDMTVADVNRLLDGFLVADLTYLAENILAALFTNVSYTFTDDDYGDLTVQPLANNDSTLYLPLPGQLAGAAANMFAAQAANISDAANPFPTLVTALTSHPENRGRVIALCATNLSSQISGLSTFYQRPDPNLTVPDTLRVVQGAPAVLALEAGIPGTFLGYVAAGQGVWVYEWSRLPAGYLIATTTEGDRPLRMREHRNAALRGFIAWAEREDAPYWERQYQRWAGFGAWNRVGAYVLRVGNGAYAIPTGYTAPIG